MSGAPSRIAIIDCGGQYTKVIDRRIRELSVLSEILPMSVDPEELAGFDAIILSGGPASVYGPDAPGYDPALLGTGKPLLGICYGMQLITQHFGGTVSSGGQAEYGVEEIRVDPQVPLFRGLDERQQVLMSHGDAVTGVPVGFTVSARSGKVIAGISDTARRIHGVQFHPEVDLTDNGMRMLENFVTHVAGLERDYLLADRIDTALEQIRTQVGDNPVVVLVSGGVDSAVTAALLVRALPAEQVHALHVDTGFMRKNESEEVVGGLRELGLVNLRHVDATDRFFDGTVKRADGSTLGPLTALQDPELKRELVGTMFMEVLREELERLELDFDHAYFAQGTLRPDLIESGNPGVSAAAQSIKTHHNDVPMVRVAREQGRVVETNADWHKDEVRQVARDLGLSEQVASRQPFPGPGLVLRVVTWNSDEDWLPETLQAEVDLLLAASLPGVTGTVLPFRTVGVQGDNRSHRFLCMLETADLSDPRLNRAGQLLPGETEEVNRVVVLVASRSAAGSLRPYASTITRQQVDLLKEIDALARAALDDVPASQLFCVLLPLGEAPGRYTVALRSIITNDYMTGRHAHLGSDLPVARLRSLAEDVLARFNEVDAFVYDVTGKPPATVEWQ